MENKKYLEMIQDLESKISLVLDEEKVKLVREAAGMYYSLDDSTNGLDFWREHILEKTQDYPTDAMKFWQANRELKGRLGRLYDEAIAFQKAELDLQELQLDLEDLQKRPADQEIDKRTLIQIARKELELKQASIRLENAKLQLERTQREVEDFKQLCDQYSEGGKKILPYEKARVEEIRVKMENRYLHHVLTGTPLTTPEHALLSKNGVVAPPSENVIKKLRLLGRDDLAVQEHSKLVAAERMHQLVLSGAMNQPLPQLPADIPFAVKDLERNHGGISMVNPAQTLPEPPKPIAVTDEPDFEVKSDG
jgi:hypothetical protein